jgi:hypothetical protein
MKAQRWDDDLTDFSFSCIFDNKLMHSSCIVRVLTKHDLHTLKKRLNEISQIAWYPLYVPILFIEMRLQGLPALISKIRQFIVRVARTTGTHKNYQERLGLTQWKNRKVQDTWNDPDFEAAPAELTSIASDCAYYESISRTRLRLLSRLKAIHMSIVAADNALSKEAATTMFAQKLHFMETCVTEIESRTAYFGKKAEIQLQMVCLHGLLDDIPVVYDID